EEPVRGDRGIGRQDRPLVPERSGRRLVLELPARDVDRVVAGIVQLDEFIGGRGGAARRELADDHVTGGASEWRGRWNEGETREQDGDAGRSGQEAHGSLTEMSC